jgi:hypothetical protein
LISLFAFFDYAPPNTVKICQLTENAI